MKLQRSMFEEMVVEFENVKEVNMRQRTFVYEEYSRIEIEQQTGVGNVRYRAVNYLLKALLKKQN